ncbi:MAG TPA: DUF2865 domain-containing protein [Xanthobacteraceae bacterium]|nr:DUF2865 domain-containing protein [Xanthobacteraceae bacterium]
MNAPRLAGIASLAAASLVALLGAAGAQLLPPQNIPGGAPPPGVQGPRPMYDQPGSAVCVRLEASLAQLNTAATGGANPEQTRRYEEAIQRQRFELDQTIVQAKRLGCDTGGGFFLFGNTRPPQCDGLNNQIGRMRNNLERMISELGNLRGGSTDLNRDLQRRQLVSQLAQNNCGPQYRQAAPQPQRPRGLLEALFGSGLREESTIDQAPLDMPMAGTYRTLCVRTCDGFFFPISFATVPARFNDDAQTCQRLCPAAETMLFSHRNPGEEVDQAISINGIPYTEMPNAFKYRQSFDTSCSCRAAGESWAEALGVGRDETLQRGDIVVTEQRAKQMSQARPVTQKGASGAGKGTPAAAAESAPAAKEEAPLTPLQSNRRVRIVGPQFYPVR